MDPLNHASVLIVSDDTEFARAIVARWQAERHVPEITLATNDVWRPASAAAHDLVIAGPVRDGKASVFLSSLSPMPGMAAVCVTEDERATARVRAQYPHLVVVPQEDGWAGTVILVASETLKRMEAARRAQRAERSALESHRHATLGRYMLDMRPGINNALTSVLGNADLVLLEPGQMSPDSREQIRTIHTMALRLNEIMQRFSSLAAEMRAGEKESQAETEEMSHRLVTGP